MSKDTRNYYERELDLVDFHGKHPAKILIGSEGKTTRTLDVNHESATALIRKLLTVFGTDIMPETDGIPKRVFSPAPVEEKARPLFSLERGRDRNGNALLKIRCQGKGFSIQTNGNLPQTHRDGITARTPAEMCSYVIKYGSERQKRILGIQ